MLWVWQDIVSLFDIYFKVTSPNDKVSSGESQPFEPEPFTQRGSGEGQNPDPEATTNWASNELEYDASGSGEQEEMQRESGTSVRLLLFWEL